MEKVSRDLLVKAINESRDGVIIVDAEGPDNPVIYVNLGFEQITGYPGAEAIGKNLRFLYGNDNTQPGLDAVRRAISNGEGCLVTMSNYRKDGTMFWNELSISSVRNPAGKLTHFIGIQKDVSARVMLEEYLHRTGVDLSSLRQQLTTLVNIDPLVGICNRHRFDEQLVTLLANAKRSHSELAVMMIDLDRFALFNERYGTSAGDECLRIVGNTIARSFSRASDCAARYEGAQFAVVSLGVDIGDLREHAQKLCEKVRELSIPHTDSPHGIVTISIGGVSRVPYRDTKADELIKQAEVAMYAAKRHGRVQVQLVS